MLMKVINSFDTSFDVETVCVSILSFVHANHKFLKHTPINSLFVLETTAR